MDENIFLTWMTQKQITIPTLLLSSYKKIGLGDREFVTLLQIHACLEEGYDFATPELLSERMNLPMSECAELLGFLIRHQYVAIDKTIDQQGIVNETISLIPLWKKLYAQLQNEQAIKSEKTQIMTEQELFKRFEQEFGRPLSPIEIETISMWLDLDSHHPTLILGALREAVISGKLSFRYIDKILLEWKKKNIQTLEQAKAHSEQFRQIKKPTEQGKKKIEEMNYPGFQWLKQ